MFLDERSGIDDDLLHPIMLARHSVFELGSNHSPRYDLPRKVDCVSLAVHLEICEKRPICGQMISIRPEVLDMYLSGDPIYNHPYYDKY